MFFLNKTKWEWKYSGPQQNGAVNEGPAEPFNLISWLF